MIAICLTEGCEDDYYKQRPAERALAALSLTSRLFHQIFDLPLYKWNRDCKKQFLSWAIQNRSFRHMEKALALGYHLDSVIFAAFPEEMFYDELRPLQIAIKCGHNDVLKWLLEHGANPDPGDSIQSGDPDIRELVAIETSALHMALRETKNEEAVHMLLDHGAKIYFANPIYLRSTVEERPLWPDTTALHLAAIAGMVGVVERLLLRGNAIRVDYFDGSGHTALHHCASLKYSRKAIVDLLLRHGAEASVEILHNTLPEGHIDNVLTLMQAVADAASLDPPWGFEPWTYQNLSNYIRALDSRIDEFEFSGPFGLEEEIKIILTKFIELGADFNDPPDEDSDDDSDAPEHSKAAHFPSCFTSPRKRLASLLGMKTNRAIYQGNHGASQESAFSSQSVCSSQTSQTSDV